MYDPMFKAMKQGLKESSDERIEQREKFDEFTRMINGEIYNSVKRVVAK